MCIKKKVEKLQNPGSKKGSVTPYSGQFSMHPTAWKVSLFTLINYHNFKSVLDS